MKNEQDKANENGHSAVFMQPGNDGGVWDPGINKREYFAAKAMQGLLSNLDPNSSFCPNADNVEYMTKLSVFAADSLLAELSKEITTKTNENEPRL